MLQQSERLVCAHIPRSDDLAVLVRAAATGDPHAIERLVARFDRTLRGVARSYRLSSWDTDDVIQATWLQFMLHGRELREPAAVGGWLVTTARRESLRLLQRHVRESLTDDPARGEADGHAEPDRELLAAERRDLLRNALAQLPARQRGLMALLTARPELSYEQVGRMLTMPVGSIGPTRARSLERLRESGTLQALHAAGN